eukprot:3710738-Pleurochrysis_carterae.AAC.1
MQNEAAVGGLALQVSNFRAAGSKLAFGLVKLVNEAFSFAGLGSCSASASKMSSSFSDASCPKIAASR